MSDLKENYKRIEIVEERIETFREKNRKLFQQLEKTEREKK